jgi:hypothetical protein
MNRALIFVLFLGACAKSPPKTQADVDTMREASFVKDINDDKDAGAKTGPTVIREDDDDTPVPAANNATAQPAPADTAASTKLPDPDISTSKKPSAKERVTKAECAKMFDRFFELVLQSDERFKDIGAEGKAMVRQMASQDQRFVQMQKDCESDVSRSKFNCAMAAKSSNAWQACFK